MEGYYELEDSPNTVGGDRTYLSEDHLTILGESEYMTLHVFGSSDCQQSLCYSILRSGYQDVHVIRTHNGTSHCYTNVIGICGEYSIEGSTYSDQYTWGQSNPSTTLPEIFQGLILKEDNHIRSYTYSSDGTLNYNSETTEEGLYAEFGINLNLNNPIKTVLLYIDSYLAIFTPYYPKGRGNNSEDWPYFYNVRRSMSQLSDLDYDCTSQDRSVVVCNSSGSNLYNSEYDYDKSQPKTVDKNKLEADSRLHHMVEDESESIPFPHRWIRALRILGYGQKISGFTNVVKCVNKGGPQMSLPIMGIAYCTSTYNRFTDYWILRQANDPIGVLRDSDKLPTTIQHNCILCPIFKPWAAVELVVFSPSPQGGGNGNFGVGVPENNSTYKLMHEKLVKNYGSKFITRYVYNSENMIYTDEDKEKNKERVVKNFVKYYRTQSPFRIEQYLCHGSRLEYDVNRPDSGRTGLMVTGNFGFGNEAFNELHTKCNSNNTKLSLKWNVFS